MFQETVDFIRACFSRPEGFIPLHAPHFGGNEKAYLNDTIDSTYVSSVGEYVTRFESMMKEITGSAFAVAAVNGTTALHLALVAAGIRPGDEVITQPLTFIATANAISHAGAIPVFVDVDRDTLGLSPAALGTYLHENAELNDAGECINKTTGRRIVACIPMHTFGFPLRVDEVVSICAQYHIIVIEDAAESLGSYYKEVHTGNFGVMATFSFNGNKTVTCGGGGAVLTNDEKLATRLKHLSTTAKKSHAWEFIHDEVAYNYRMPNLNAALACAQLEQLSRFLENKKELALLYQEYFASRGIDVVLPIKDATPNYWLNTILLKNEEEKETFLEFTNGHQVMTRPAWRLMNRLPMYQNCPAGNLDHATWLEQRIVNIPSSFRSKA